MLKQILPVIFDIQHTLNEYCLVWIKHDELLFVLHSGAKPSDGVPDMTAISEIDEYGINENLRVRYKQDKIYVRLSIMILILWLISLWLFVDLYWLNSGGSKSLQNTICL